MDAFLGEIRMLPFNFAPGGWAECDGRVLDIASNTALFSVLSNKFGGDGKTTFALPGLRGALPLGQAGNIGSRSSLQGGSGSALRLNSIGYYIATQGPRPLGDPEPSSPVGNLGEVRSFGFVDREVENWLPCDGRSLSAESRLARQLGSRYGASRIPDLRNRAARGVVDHAPNYDVVELAAATTSIGQLNINYCISLNGADSATPMVDGFLGECRLFAGPEIPSNFGVANGAVIKISQNPALYSLYGTRYGGNGTTTFVLPNLGDGLAAGLGASASSFATGTGGLTSTGLTFAVCMDDGEFPSKN